MRWAILMAIGEGICTVPELSKHLKSQPSAMAAAVVKLVHGGLVEREAGPRPWRLRLSKQVEVSKMHKGLIVRSASKPIWEVEILMPDKARKRRR